VDRVGQTRENGRLGVLEDVLALDPDLPDLTRLLGAKWKGGDNGAERDRGCDPACEPSPPAHGRDTRIGAVDTR
jgi:hypothetical protein